MPPAARVTDPHVCPLITVLVPHVGGPVVGPGAVTVLTMGMVQAQATNLCVCVGPPDMIAMGSTTVLASMLPAARLGDPSGHGGVILGLGVTVIIGG